MQRAASYRTWPFSRLLQACSDGRPPPRASTLLGRLDQYTWLDRFIKGRKALVLFGGTRGGVYRAETAQRFMEASAAPILALHDFDPSGLHKTSALPRLEALCLPEWSALEPVLKRNKPEPMFAHQRRQLRGDLDRVECRHVARAWELMNAAGNGSGRGFSKVADSLYCMMSRPQFHTSVVLEKILSGTIRSRPGRNHGAPGRENW